MDSSLCESILPNAIFYDIHVCVKILHILGNLSGESKNAFWNPADFNLLMLLGCLRTGTAPNVDWLIEMTPVDFVSKAIVDLTQVRTYLLHLRVSLPSLLLFSQSTVENFEYNKEKCDAG